jgi:hypothetical protein
MDVYPAEGDVKVLSIKQSPLNRPLEDGLGTESNHEKGGGKGTKKEQQSPQTSINT